MELGLLSNMLVNRQPYWQAYIPPLFSAIAADRANVRIVEPPPVGWSRRNAWKAIRSQVKPCDTLFWTQLSSRPAASIHLASLNRLGARRANFVIDAWKPVITKIGVAATVERLNPCFIAYLEATTELKRRFPLAKFVWLPHAGNTDIFYPRKGGKPNFTFYMGRRHEPLHQALVKYCEARGLKYLYSDKFLFGEELGRAASSAEYFVASPREIIDPKTNTAYSPLSPRYFEGLAAERASSAPYPEAANTTRFCRPTRCVKSRSTVLIWLSVSTKIVKTRQSTRRRRRGVGARASFLAPARSANLRLSRAWQPVDVRLMPQARIASASRRPWRLIVGVEALDDLRIGASPKASRRSRLQRQQTDSPPARPSHPALRRRQSGLFLSGQFRTILKLARPRHLELF